MALILNIETSTTACSVALARNGEVLTDRFSDNGYQHAEHLHVFIRELLSASGARLKDLDAVAVSRGPGSYTGLRIGYSSAKGLAYALGIPLIAVDTLAVMAAVATQRDPGFARYRPMIDARRMEVYTAEYDSGLAEISPPEAAIVDAEKAAAWGGTKRVAFFGNGMPKCRALLEGVPGAGFLEDVKPSAGTMGSLSVDMFRASQFADVAYSEPLYVKEFFSPRNP